MIHLSSLLPNLQYCYLFIIYSFLSSFCYSFCIIILSPLRYNWFNVVFFINDSLIFFAPSSPILLSVHYIYHCYCNHFCYYFHLSSQLRSSWVNVVLIINDSLIFFAPSTPTMFPVHYFIISLFLQIIYAISYYNIPDSV